MARETELGFKIKRVLSNDDQWKKIVKETEEFYEMLDSNPAEIEVGNIKQTIVQLQKVRAEYNKINNDVGSNRGQIEFAQTLCAVLEKAEDKFGNIGVMFKNVNNNTKKYVTGLSNITQYLGDSNFGVKFVDVGAQFGYLQSQAETLFDTLKSMNTVQFGRFDLDITSMDIDQLRECLSILHNMRDIVAQMTDIDPNMDAKDFVGQLTPRALGNAVRQAESDLADLKRLRLDTTEELRKRREIISEIEDGYTWEDYEHEDTKQRIHDDETYNNAIENIQRYIDKRRELVDELRQHEYDLFAVDGIDEYENRANAEIERLQFLMQELKDLRSGNKNGDPIAGDFSEVVQALNEIHKAIREIKEAFDPLTQAFANEESAMHSMVTANVSQLEELINKFKEVHDMVDSLNKKEFNFTQVISQGSVQKAKNASVLGLNQEKARKMVEIYQQLNQAQLALQSSHGRQLSPVLMRLYGFDEIANAMDRIQGFNAGAYLSEIDSATTAQNINGILTRLGNARKELMVLVDAINREIPNAIDTSLWNSLDEYDKKINDIRSGSALPGAIQGQAAAASNIQSELPTPNTDNAVAAIKSLKELIDVELKVVREKIEETFDFRTLDPNLTNIQSITDQIYQQFVELQTKIKSLDFGIALSEKNAETASDSSSAVDVDTIKSSLLELEQVTGKTLSSVIQEYDSLDAELKSKVNSILQSLGLINDNSEFLFASMRGGNAKAFVSDNFVILQKALDMSADELQLFVNKLQEAEKEGVQVASVLGQVQSTLASGNFGYEIQQRASGSNVHETQKELIDLNSALRENQVILGASSDQLQKFISDYIKLGELGIEIDPSKTSNFLYDAEKGFSFIDLRLQRINAEAKTTEVLFREITSVLANTAGFNKLGQDVNIGESSGAIIAHVASAFKNLGLATDAELEKLVQERYDGFGNLYDGYLKEQANIAKAVQSATDAIKQEGEIAEQTTPKKDAFTAANHKLADSMKETGDVGKFAADGIDTEADAVEKAAKKIAQSAKKIRADQSTIVDKYANLYGGSGKVNPDLAYRFNAVLDKADIDVSSIKASFGIKTYKDNDNNVIEYDYIRLIAEGTDALGKATTETREYEVATGGLIKKMASFKEVKDTFNVAQEVENANSKVAELEKRMGSFKIDLTEVKGAAKNITDSTSLDIFEKALDSANQKLKELKATLKSSKSLDPVVNSEGMMSNLAKTVETYRESIKKFSDVEGFGELESYLTNITTYLNSFNDAKKLGDGKAMAESVASTNKEIAKYNAQLNLVKARYQENSRVAKESEQTRKKALNEEKALIKEIVSEDKLTRDKDNQLSLLTKQQAQWEKNGQLTDEVRAKINAMFDSLVKVTDSEELKAWKQQWSTVKNEILTTKYELEATAKAQHEIYTERKAARNYWDKEFQYSLNGLITPDKRPELEQLKAYMLQQAEVTQDAVEERYSALMTIVSNKNNALQKLMAAKGQNEKQYWQDEYSAWFGAWNALDQNKISEFFSDVGNQAIIGADKVDKFNDELERSKILSARSKDKEDASALQQAEQLRKQELAAEKALIAEEKSLMKEIVAENKLMLDKDKQFALLSKQQAQWNKNGQLTDEISQTINSMLDSLARVTNSDELAIWKKQWSIVKDEVLTTKYEIEAATQAQKATANERKASGAYWNKEFKYSLNNIITPDKRPELEQLKVYMLQQAKVSQDAVEEQYDAIFTIIKKKNDSLAKLMVANGPNDKQYWQDEYSAWFGAWNKLDSDVVSNFFADAGNQAILGAGKIEKFNEELERSKILENKIKDNDYNKKQQEQDKTNREKQKYGQTDYNRLNKFSESLHASVRALQKDSSVSTILDELVAEFDETYTKIESMRKQFKEDPSLVTDDMKAQFKDSVHYADDLKQKIENIFKESQKLSKMGNPIATGDEDASKIDNLKYAMISFANTALDGEVRINGFNQEGTKMYATLSQAGGEVKNITVALDDASGRLKAFTTGTTQATNEWEDFKAQIVSGVKSMVGMYVGVQEGVQAVRTGVNYVKEIDLAMTELKKVTDETDASYRKFLKDAGESAAVIGSTIRDFTEATSTFARLGYSMEESSKMAETAIIYKNVADGLDSVEESAESIISTMMAFGIEANDTMSIIDRFNAVGNNFAITSAGIGDALQRSASALFSAGNTIDESVALVTAANSVIQNPEQVGTALKTLALRLRGAKTELEEAGEDVDGMAESTSQLQAKLKALTHGRVDIMLDADTFKSTTQILREMSDAWEDMTDIERAAALELMGGKRQANILSSVIQNFETVEDVIETSMDSAGSAIAENEKWLDSIEGKTYQLTNALQTMWSNMLDSEVIKGFLDFGIGAVEMLDTGAERLIAFVAALRLLAQFKGINVSGILQGIGQSAQQINSATQALNALSAADTVNGVFKPSSITAYAAAVSQLTPKLQAQSLATKGLSNEQIRYALALNGVDQANAQVAMSQIQVAKSTQQAISVTGADAAAILAAQKIKLSDAAANFLQSHATEEVTEEKLKNAVATGVLTKAEATQITMSLGLTSTNYGLKASFDAVRTSISLMFKSNPVGFILNIVTAVLSLIPIFNMLTDSADDVNDAFNEAISTIKETQKQFRDLKQSADDIIPRFAELAKGVDEFGNNVNLTDDEYKEFISLNNEIADLFPEISSGMDSNGNAMLSLSYTADTLSQSLWDLVEAERATANQEIADTMPNVLTGIKSDVDAYKDEVSALETRLEAYKDAKQSMDDLRSDETKQQYKDAYGDDWQTKWEISISLSNDQAIYNLQEAFGAWERPEEWSRLVEQYFVDDKVDWYGVLNSAEMQNAIAGLENQIDDFSTRVSKKWQQLNPVVTAWANTDFIFNNLSKDMQSAAQVMIANFDFSEHGDKTEAEIQDYIKTHIINKIDELTPTTQKKLTSLLSINANDYSLADYKNQISNIANEIAGLSSFTYDELMQRTGYSDVLKDYEKTANNILEILDNSIPKYYESMVSGTRSHFRALEKYGDEVDQLKDKIYSLSPNEITKAFDIISKYGIKTWDELADALANKTFDVALNYDAEKEGREKLLAAIEESVSATGLSAESIANLKKRYQDLESYDPAKLFEETTNGIHLNTKALNELEREYENLNKTSLDNKLKGLTDKYNELTDEIQNCADASERAALYAQRNNILAQINDTATLAARYEGLTSAYNKWQEVQSGKDERNMYDGIISGKKELDEEMKRGWLDKGSIKYLELLSGKDLSTAKYDEILSVYKQLNEQIAGKYDVFDFFTTDSSGNSTTKGIYNFFDTVLAKSAEIQEKIGREVIKKNSDGSYVFDFGVDGDKAIAETLGISEELVQIILRAAQDAGFDINLNSAYSNLADFRDEVESVNNRLKEIGATTYTFNINSTNINNVEKQIEEAKNAIKNLENEDGTIKVGISEEDYQNAKTLLATLIYQKQTLDDAAILHIDTSNAESDIEFIVQKLQDFKAAFNDYEVKAAVGADTSQAEADMHAAIVALQGTDPTIRASLGLDLSKSNEEINTAINNITVDKLIEIGLDSTLVDEYMEAEHSTTGEVVWDNNIQKVTEWMSKKHEIDGTVNWENNIKNVRTHFTANGTINWSGSNEVNGTANVSGNAYAGGSWGAQKTETSLVGELGPEILVRNGKWTTVGENGAEFTQVKKGDIIFNHKQTQELLKNGHVTGRGKAYSSGTAFSDGSGPGKYTITSANINSSKAAKDAADEFREVFDWIAVRLEEITEDLDFKSAKLENATDFKKQNAIIDDMIDLNQKLYDNLIAGANKYYSYAKTLLAKIPAEYRQAAQDGAIAIEEFVGEVDEKTLEAIQEYREWVQKGADATQQAEEVLTEIRNLAIQQFENAQKFGDVRATVEDSQTEKLQNAIDLIEESGNIADAAYYEAMMENSNKKIEYLTKSRNAMQKELDDAVASGQLERGSDEWYELVNQMYEVDAAIDEATLELEQFQNAINDIEWENFDQLINRIDYLKDETQNLIDLMDSDDLFDKQDGKEYWGNGDVSWTDEGITTLGLYAQQMEIAEYEARQYGEAIDKLTADYKAGLYSENEYLEKLNELKSAQYDSIEAYEEAKEAIVELNKARIDHVKKGIEKEIDAYSELIEKKKEALDAEKDLHDFQKSVMDQQKNIADLQRQLDALAYDDSASARAKKAQLQSEIAEANAELEETYYDRSISNQQDALDKELEDFQEAKEKEMEELDLYLENVEQVVADSLMTVQANATTVYDTLNAKADEYGLNVSDAVTKPWQDGSIAISGYQETFDTAVSSTMDQLDAMKNKWQEVIDKMQEASDINVDAINQENANYVSATKQTVASSNTTVSSSNNQSSTSTNSEPAVGSTVKADANAQIYATSTCTNGQRQYYDDDPYYTVVDTKDDAVLVRHKSQNTGYTGWLKDKDVTTNVTQKYAKGTKSAPKDQWAIIDELGDELQLIPGKNGRLEYIKKGTGIIPAHMTERLMDLVMNPQEMLDRNRPQIKLPSEISSVEVHIDHSIAELVHIDNCSTETLADVEKIVNKAIEKNTQKLNQSLRKYVR